MPKEKTELEGEGIVPTSELLEKIKYSLPMWLEIYQDEFVYAIALDSECKKMLAWYEANEMEILPSNSKKKPKLKKCVVKKWFELDLIEEMRPIYEDKSDLVSIFEKTDWYRISDNSTCAYGDGGSSNLVYPVWANDSLPVPESIRSRTTELLHELSAERKDYQYNSPVEDIIDPDLCPNILPNGNWFNRHKAELEDKIKSLNEQGGDTWKLKKQLRNFEQDFYPSKVTEHVKIRETYCWIPSEFKVSLDGSVKIMSRIHNLPPYRHKELYLKIQRIFKEMVPGFKVLGFIKEDEETNLQVIVKAQSYNMRPLSTYAGRWHMEGHTENIVGVGVYYCQVDSGGNVKFRPDSCPDPYYAENSKIQTAAEASVVEGAALVFGNTIPHRFRLIRNATSEYRRRTFINFFIVDPKKPLKSTKTIPSTDFLKSVLVHYVNRTLKKTLPLPIASNIIKFIPGGWASLVEAKKFRAQAREAMIKEKTGWGWINWGNCGTAEFIASLTTARPDFSGDTLHSTDSDKQTVSSIPVFDRRK